MVKSEIRAFQNFRNFKINILICTEITKVEILNPHLIAPDPQSHEILSELETQN
jgi:hypothetical protein